MEPAHDLSYYAGPGTSESAQPLEIAIGGGEVVTIDELPEDASELEGFLLAEKCGVKYWILVSQAYAQAGRMAAGAHIAEAGVETAHFSAADSAALKVAGAWVYLALAAAGTQNKQENLEKAARHLASASAGESGPASISALLAEAQHAVLSGRGDVAAQMYGRVLKIDPDNCYALMGQARFALALSHMQASSSASAASASGAQTGAGAQSGAQTQTQAQIQMQTRNYAHALKLFQQALATNPAVKPDPRLGVGVCFWVLRERKMARASWDRALELDPENHHARLFSALAAFDDACTNSVSDELFVQGYTHTMSELAQVHLARPRDPAVLVALASYYFSRGDYDAVEKVVARASEIATKTSASTATENNSQLPAASAAVAASAYTARVFSDCSLWRGRVAFAQGDFPRAQKHFYEAVRSCEANVLARVGLGQAQACRDLVDDAVLTFEAILKAYPACMEAAYSLGMLHAASPVRERHAQAIVLLERYIRLCSARGSAVADKKDAAAALNKEPVALNAYLTLSRLHEARDPAQALAYLQRAVDARAQIGLDAPAEVHNNMGVFCFAKNNTSDAAQHFERALAKLKADADADSSGAVPATLCDDMRVSVSYNLARARETTDPTAAAEQYTRLLAECPGYFSAKLRLLFLDAVSGANTDTDTDTAAEISALLQEHASNLEVRSFYGWYIKTFGKRLGLKPDAESSHQKETLVAHDSHDAYALISLANVYCVMAKDLKNPRDEEKRKKYYVRALELFTKVLSIDPKNVFAAQGFAIVYIENKQYAQGLDILRKIRDSLNDISVYLNLGHVLVEMKQYAKAIESYEIASVRYASGSDPKILGFLGRAWYSRGLAEKHLPHLKKALEFAQEALSKATGITSSYVFNVAFLQFQIAEYLTKETAENRLVEDITDAISGVHSAIASLNALASDDETHAPFPKPELKARANMGATLLLRLDSCLEETKENITQMNTKLEEAKKLREQEEARRAKEAEEASAAKKARDEALALERIKLQEQAQQWAEEARANNATNESDDDKAFDEESGKEKKSKKTKKKGKGKGKKKDFINDSDADSASEPEPEPEVESDVPSDKEESPKKATKAKKGGKRKRRAIEDDDDEDNEANEAKSGGEKDGGSPTKKKTKTAKKAVSNSSEDEDDGLF